MSWRVTSKGLAYLSGLPIYRTPLWLWPERFSLKECFLGDIAVRGHPDESYLYDNDEFNNELGWLALEELKEEGLIEEY